METRSRWREQRRLKRIRGRITALLVVMLAAVAVLFLLSFFGRDVPEPEQPALSGEVWVADADGAEGLHVAEVYEAAAGTSSVRAPLRRMAMPVDGSLTSGYGSRSDPLTGQPDFHPAVDLAAPRGTPVCAAADGVVSETGWSSVYGNYVRIWHGDGIETQYGHCEELCCAPGDAVSAGDPVALVGMTGRATGYHLDFQVFQDGKNVDPAPWLGLS